MSAVGPFTRAAKLHKRTSIQKAFPFSFPVWQQGGEWHWQMTSYQSYADEGFMQNSVLYSAIMYKVKAISQAPLRAYTGEEDNPKLLPSNAPLSILLRRPNDFQTWMEFQQLAIVYLNLSGNVYIYMKRPALTGLPEQLYLLRPDNVRILVQERQKIAYEYRPMGIVNEAVPIPIQDIIHIKFPNPLDPLEGQGYGMSPIMPAARTGDVDNQVTKFLYGLFRHGVMGVGAFTFKKDLNEPTLARIREQAEDIYGGADKWHKPFVLDGEASWVNITPSFDKMGFKDIDGRSETRLLGPLGVPGMLIGMRSGMGSSTFSNFEQADTVFWQNTMIPELRLFEQEYEYYLTDENAFVKFDVSRVPSLQEDMTPVIDNYYKLWSTGIDRARAAALAGLPLEPADGDEVSYLPATIQPALTSREEMAAEADAAIARMPAKLPSGEENAPEQEEETPPEKEPEKSIVNVDLMMERKALLYWRKQEEVSQDWEGRYREGGKDVFDQQQRDLQGIVADGVKTARRRKASVQWEAVQANALDYLNTNGGEQWSSTFAPLIKGLVTDAVNEWEAALGLQFDVQNLLALQWYDQYVLRFAQDVNATTKTAISNLLQQAQLEGWTGQQAQNHLGELFQQWMAGDLSAADFEWLQQRMPDYRLEMIVRTETIRSYNAGTNALFGEWGVKEKQWWATYDERACPFCLSMHQKVIPVGGAFATLGDTITGLGGDANQTMTVGFGDVAYPPLHVNCRCTLLPVL